MNESDNFDPYSGYKIIEEKVLHGSRKIISERLKESYQNKVHASISRYMEVEKLREFTDKIKKGSIVDHFIRAVALSLSEKPAFNATYDGFTYKIYKDINISYAVNTARGPVTPVLRNADRMSLDDFCSKRREIITLVLKWKHNSSDISGGTFTITNLGNFGVDLTSAIINPPQIAILGMARTCKLNISWDGSEPGIKELLPITVTYDHRVVDGVGAAEFAQVLQDKINNPQELWK